MSRLGVRTPAVLPRKPFWMVACAGPTAKPGGATGAKLALWASLQDAHTIVGRPPDPAGAISTGSMR